MSLNVLLIQHDPVDAQAVRAALASSGDESFKVEWVRSCAEGLARLAAKDKGRASTLAAVLVDLFLPDSNGIETFDQLFEATAGLPILVLVASQDEEIAKLAVQRGAQDYLLKGRLDSYLLSKALGSMIERAANAEAPRIAS